jgi:hypothetical protein
LASPLGNGKQLSLRAAARAFGGPIVLPDTAAVNPSDVGAVWINPYPFHGTRHDKAGVAVAVTFPGQGLIIHYVRPPIDDMAGYVQNNLQSSPGSQAITLNGAPALNIPQAGSDWGSITFVGGGTTGEVIGHADEASLQAVAESILNRATTSR